MLMVSAVYYDGDLVAIFEDRGDAETFIESLEGNGHMAGYEIRSENWRITREG